MTTILCTPEKWPFPSQHEYFSTGMPGYMVGGTVRQPYAGVDFIPQSGIYEFGDRTTGKKVVKEMACRNIRLLT